ncbi:ArsR/SmtB family transcription factor [Streptomyces meridianus]|uniref:Metalloregulator ArsR/SmtB family transcription factor n=1 Tax=Streptomyces meridianus TaxID=2938945 RepID=A0ABT0XCR7_9ACTN|nr:metalloregulator ArsR/SmtB family transcription factor [Streptomyces meridianus]MCM2580229.1 metalloregulator ArsR/SmtB family transcription factor [Streptomyces meridianus]
MPRTPLEQDIIETYTRWFQALADPTRILIVRYLAEQRAPVPAGSIVEHLKTSQPTVSHHLKTLHQAGILTRRRSGANILYSVDDRCVSALPHAAATLLGGGPQLPGSEESPEQSAEPRAARQGSGLPGTREKTRVPHGRPPAARSCRNR